jgi:hypothetical protein
VAFLSVRRVLLGGIALLLFGALTAPSRPAAAAKSDPLLFVFLRVDQQQDVAILRPMIAPDIGVQLDSGSRKLAQGTVLSCTLSAREHAAIVEGQVGKITEMLLECDERKFIVKTIDFAPRTK